MRTRNKIYETLRNVDGKEAAVIQTQLIATSVELLLDIRDLLQKSKD